MKTSIPSCKNELQCLTSRLVALGSFMAQLKDKLNFFFLTLKGASASGWTNDCELAFEDIKSYLTQPPILSSPQPGEQLYMYLAVSNCVVSVVLFRYIKDNEQRPFYYVSKAMVDVETRYSKMEQTTLALRSVAQKLRPYFQAHEVIILTNQLLRNILHKPDLSGRMVRWVIELDEYRIKYQPKLAMKGQVMADFIAETSQKLLSVQVLSKRDGGHYTSTEHPEPQDPKWASFYNLQSENRWNKLSSSYFQPLIMKSSMRQSSPD